MLWRLCLCSVALSTCLWLNEDAAKLKLCASGDHPKFTLLKCVYKVNMSRKLKRLTKLHRLRFPHLLPGTANGLLPVRVAAWSDWLEEEELEDLASLSGWERCSSRGCCLFQTTIWGEEVGPFLLRREENASSTEEEHMQYWQFVM